MTKLPVLVATVGTTSSGAVDNMTEIRDVGGSDYAALPFSFDSDSFSKPRITLLFGYILTLHGQVSPYPVPSIARNSILKKLTLSLIHSAPTSTRSVKPKPVIEHI